MKTTRQRAILSLIATRPIHSQEELAHMLESQGYEATQATVAQPLPQRAAHPGLGRHLSASTVHGAPVSATPRRHGHILTFTVADGAWYDRAQ